LIGYGQDEGCAYCAPAAREGHDPGGARDSPQVSQPVVSDYENDVIRLPADIVIEIAGILAASTDELLGMKRVAVSASPIKNRRLYRRMQEIEKLPRRDQDALLRTIEAFISKTG
jgi:hypothetical protein